MDPIAGLGSATAAGSPRGEDRGVLTLLIDSVTDYAIFALDPDGRVLTWNPGAQRLKGYKPDEIIGQKFSVFYSAIDNEADLPNRELAIAVAEGRYEDEGWRIRKDGTRFWANVVITALRGDDGRLVGFGKVTRDLTERKAAEDTLRDSEERFRLLVTAVADYAIFLLRPDGTVDSWNLGAERLKGYRADEVIGRHLSTFYTAEDRAAGVPDRALQEAVQAGRVEMEGWRLRKDGSRFWADVVITALRGSDGTLRGFAKVTRDLTDRKRGEDALRGVLERERETAARLRELDRMKTDLVAIVAHDLRGPVGVLESTLHLLQHDWDRLDEAERRDLIGRMETRVGTLAGLVDDVFDLAMIEAGRLTIDAAPFDLAAVVGQVVADARVSAPDRDVAVQSEPATALGDGRRTWQVLMNLVSNAVKFSSADTTVDVAVERVDDEVVVSVTDRGPGVPAAEEHLLFTRFGRLPSSEGTPGTGMGLFIAKSLAEAQGGRLWVESTPGVGATFRFTLPVAP